MAQYVLDMTKPHRKSLIELVNNDNAATIGTPLAVADVNFINERQVDKPGEGIDRDWAVTLENVLYTPDTVEVYFNKVDVNDVMTMTAADGDFDWYDPDDWEDGVSEPLAIAAFKAAATRQGIDVDNTMEGVTVRREFRQEENHFYMIFTYQSFVFESEAEFRMPKHFSEIVTVTDLNGFIYSPIDPADVVY